MNSMIRDPIEDSIEVSALVVCVEVRKRHLPSRYTVISNQFIVNSTNFYAVQGTRLTI